MTNHKKIRYFIGIWMLTLSTALQAQLVLLPDDVVALALQHNFDIQLSNNQLRIDSVNNSYENAGFLPEIALSGQTGNSLSQVRQEGTGGSSINYENLVNNQLSAAVALNWTLFDGGKMFIRKKTLEAYQELSELELQQQIIQTHFEVLQLYYSLVMMKEQLRSIDTLISYNQTRLRIAEASFKSGNSSKTEFIQAQIDLNIAKASRITQVQQRYETKLLLLQKVGMSTDLDFETIDSIVEPNLTDRASYQAKLNAQNLNLLSIEKQRQIAGFQLNSIKRSYLPVLNLSAGYSLAAYNQSEGTILSSRSIGPEIGLGFTMPIYSAGSLRRASFAAQVNQQNEQIQYEKTRLDVQIQAESAFQAFESARQALELETINFELAIEYLKISNLQLAQGQATALEVHQAQLEFIESSARYLNLKMEQKLAELKLQALISNL